MHFHCISVGPTVVLTVVFFAQGSCHVPRCNCVVWHPRSVGSIRDAATVGQSFVSQSKAHSAGESVLTFPLLNLPPPLPESIVQPAVLKSYMRESHLSKIEERLIRPYLLRRADYSTHVRDLNELGDEMTTGTTSNTTSNSTEFAIPGVAQAAIFGGAGISEAEKASRLKNVLADLERWSKEEDAQVNTSNMKAIDKAAD